MLFFGWIYVFHVLIENLILKPTAKFYLTEYHHNYLGEKVHQGKIRNRGLDYLKEFPNLDFITSCDLVAKDLPWSYTHPVPST
jgi:hypothetical protein